jgi:hypothetical protein
VLDALAAKTIVLLSDRPDPSDQADLLLACISRTGRAVVRLCEAESQVKDLAYKL